MGEEKIVSWDFGGAARPWKQTSGARRQARTLGLANYAGGVALLCFELTIVAKGIAFFEKEPLGLT